MFRCSWWFRLPKKLFRTILVFFVIFILFLVLNPLCSFPSSQTRPPETAIRASCSPDKITAFSQHMVWLTRSRVTWPPAYRVRYSLTTRGNHRPIHAGWIQVTRQSRYSVHPSVGLSCIRCIARFEGPMHRKWHFWNAICDSWWIIYVDIKEFFGCTND